MMILNLIADAATQPATGMKYWTPGDWTQFFTQLAICAAAVFGAYKGMKADNTASDARKTASRAETTANHATGQAVDAIISASNANTKADVNGVRITSLAGGVHQALLNTPAKPATPTPEAIIRENERLNP